MSALDAVRPDLGADRRHPRHHPVYGALRPVFRFHSWRLGLGAALCHHAVH
jgi:hypothetical protein